MSAVLDPPVAGQQAGVPLLSAEGVSVQFRSKRNRGAIVHAVTDVSLELPARSTLAVVGESGSGKSTLARAVLRLVPLAAGRVMLRGDDITALRGRALRDRRRHMQMVFQDPYSSLDPSSVIANVVGEPLRVHDRMGRTQREERVAELLEQVGLPAAYMSRYPYEFSGGQRQRIAIARAIAVNPSLVVLDEAVSALDVSTQNQVLELLDDLKAANHLSYLFISHNLSVVRWIADETAVMYLGRIMEQGPTARVHESPAHPYTQSLLAAMPVPDPLVQRGRPRIVLKGDPPDPLAVITGCPFRTRCPIAEAICAERVPPQVPVAGGGWAACHMVSPTPA